jgi:hypothetical protein
MTQLAAKFSSRRLIIVCVIIALVAPAIVVKYAPERVRNDIKEYGSTLSVVSTVTGFAGFVLDYFRKHPVRAV